MRQINVEMVRWLDVKLQLNGLAQLAIKEKDARQIFICAMEACVGIYEQGGNNNGPMVRLIQDTIGNASREPWCMSLVQTCIAYAELKADQTSPVFASEHCMTVWAKTPHIQRVKTSPLRGAIVIWNYEGTTNGHTGMVIEAKLQQHFTSVEGNTGSDGSRDGDGVYRKKRDWHRNGKLKRVGFLKPF